MAFPLTSTLKTKDLLLSDKARDLLVSLVRGATEPYSISELWRGFSYRDINVGYLTFEDWVLDQTDLVCLSPEGKVLLQSGIYASNIRKSKILPAENENLDDLDGQSRLNRVLNYYKDCLLEEGKSIYAYCQQQDSSFVTVDEEMFTSNRDFISVAVTEAGDFAKNCANNNKSAFYGYPLLLSWVETGDGEFAEYKVTPVFISRVDIQTQPTARICQLASRDIRLNPQILRECRWHDRRYAQQTLDAESDEYPSFSERVELLGSVFQNIDFQQSLDPLNVVRKQNLKSVEKGKDGFYNAGGIFLGGSNQYIKGLIADLTRLQEKSTADLEGSSLSVFFNSRLENEASDEFAQKNHIQVYSPSPTGQLLNAPQEGAVEQVFQCPLSIVTGPPGTGKSQVVASILSTAIMENKTVLFASRNNKALQVVQERMKKLSPGHIPIMRVGGDYDQQCMEYIDQLNNLPARLDAMLFSQQFECIEHHRSTLNSLERELDQKAKLLSEAGAAEELLKALRSQLMVDRPTYETAYERGKNFNAEALLSVGKRFQTMKRQMARFPRLLQRLIVLLHAKTGKPELSNLENELKKAKMSFNLEWPIDVEAVNAELQKLFRLIDFVHAVDKIQRKSLELGSAEELKPLFKEIVECKTAIAEKTPALIESKIRENLYGTGMEVADNAVSYYRSALQWLRSSALNEGKQNARLNELGDKFSKMLSRLPLWCVTNLSISKRIPLESGLFDILIIDEASQSDIPSCLPLLFRAKHAVIIGDPLQLSQITNIKSTVDRQLLRQHKLDSSDADHLVYTENSMFSAAQRILPRTASCFLSNHYRCHPDIINFANSSEWYNEQLNVLTDEGSLKRPDYWEHGIEWIDVSSGMKGSYRHDYILDAEVEKIVDLVKQLLEENDYDGTVGVVSPFKSMAQLIYDKIQREVKTTRLNTAKFDCKTAHGFQGDERDIIIYSMGIHPEMPRGKEWFIAENKNLFNVALSRARAAFVVVGDKEAVANFSYQGRPVEYLRNFLQYFESLGEKQETEVGEPIFKPQQLWEERFYKEALKPAGLPVISQYKLGPYKLDFALLSEADNRKLDIEVDGETYHKDSAGKRLRHDIDRDIYVKSQDGGSWDVMRFWVYELKEDMDGCLRRIQQWMN